MKRNLIFLLILIYLTLSGSSVFAQDRALYITEEKKGKSRQKFTMDFSRIKRPKSIDDFTQLTHLPPVPQDTTGTCWCFSTISFLESELARIGKTPVKLSEIYIVYWEYVEKVRRFVQEKGESLLGQGSEHNAVLRQMKAHGLVRRSDYTGLIAGRTGHNHSPLFREIRSYLNYLKKNDIWDENQAVEYTKLILNKHLGKPPEIIEVDGKKITPLEYMTDVLGLNPDDYVSFISFMYAPFYQKAEFKVPDNWWHSKDYYNLPLNEFYNTIVDAVKHGYTVALGGDTSEIGKNGNEDIAIIPSFDIPGRYINQYAREFRYKNRTSTDDHAIHLIGYKKLGKHSWFLIKDSGRSARRGKFKGYYMFRDDYVKLKILNFMVHRDAVKNVLKKMKK